MDNKPATVVEPKKENHKPLTFKEVFSILCSSCAALIALALGGSYIWGLDIDKAASFILNFITPAISLVTLWLLFKAYETQTRELAVASDALKNSADEMKATNENARMTRLENVCFNMFDRYKEELSSIAVSGATGITAMSFIMDDITRMLDNDFLSNKDLYNKMNDVEKYEYMAQYCYLQLTNSKRFSEIWNTVRILAAMYNVILESGITKEKAEYLTIAIYVLLKPVELFFFKLIVGQEVNYTKTRQGLEYHSLNSKGYNVYLLIKDNLKHSPI